VALRRHGLAQRRKDVGFTQESFAERLGVERSTVVRWEAGETEPLPDIRPKIARALHISIDQLAQLLSQAQPENRENDHHCLETGEPGTPPSRSLVPLNGFSASRWKCVDPDVDIMVMQSFRAADKKVGGAHLYATVVNYLHTQLAPRLFDVSHDTDGRRVFTSAASLTELAGWMAHDAGNDATAQQHFMRSLDLAKVGGDRQLAAHICASMSHLAYHYHRPHRAIQLARQGTDTLHGCPSQSPLHAQLFTMQAKGMAALGRTGECTKLLMDAEKALGGPVNAHERSPWVSPFDEGSFAHEAARCMRQLGHFGQAQQQAQRVLELRPRDRTRSRAFGQLILATVLIAQGEVEHACALAHEVLDATQSLGSYIVIQQLVELKKLLESRQKNKAVDDFLACFDQVLRERLCLYQWLHEDHHGRSTDDGEGM
jgi:transcriptional regulator with XRE-family HTH domain